MKNLEKEKKGIGFITTVFLLISLVLTTCTYNGQKSTLDRQIIENQTDSSIYFGRHARQMIDVMGCAILKTDGLDFPFMSSAELVNQATISSDARFGILSKTGSDAKKMFTDKVVPISVNYPFFFKPIQDGMDRPKTELAYRVPASKLTRRKLDDNIKLKELQGLDTTIDWKNTGDNSYDGEKLKILAHDESGKWGTTRQYIKQLESYKNYIKIRPKNSRQVYDGLNFKRVR